MPNNFRRSLLFLICATSASAFAKPITSVIKLKEKVSIETLAQNVQDPHSDHYQKFYTPEEIRDLAAPSQSDYNQLLSSLSKEGFTVVSESPTHLWLSVSGDSAKFESVFATKIKFNGNLRQRMSSVSVPNHLALIESVAGLDNTRKARPHYKKMGQISKDIPGVPQATIKKVYGFNPLYAAGLTGAGQHIAVATYDGFHVDNVKQFYKLSQLSPGPAVDQVAFNGTAKYDPNSAMETELDAEFTGMIAPGASVHVFASATNDDTGELQMFTAILDDNRAKVVNYSWGECEAQVSVQHRADMVKVYARAVAQGVNIMVASGDSGSDSCQDGTTQADWPAAATNVVAVGGTTLAVTGDTGSESGWNGSGGGISAVFDLPAWQNQLGAPYLKRSYPDVAFNADPSSGQAVYTGDTGAAGWMQIGGTSMAAPQWSGFLALVGEARAKASKPTLGYLNPIIYAMSANDRATNFHDVTSGSNGAYSCGNGWDAVTGFGSMQADALLNTLKSN